jgi:hypothetical protein
MVKILLRTISSILNHCAFCQGIASCRPLSHAHHTQCQAMFLAWRQRFDASPKHVEVPHFRKSLEFKHVL